MDRCFPSALPNATNHVCGQGAPYMYDFINNMTAGYTPSTVHIHNTALAAFFRKYLLTKFFSVFKWELPDTWSSDYFKYCLYEWGFVAIINTDKFGVIPQGCNLSGYDVFYRPNMVQISNPLLRGMRELKINVDCALIKMQPNYCGIMDIINYYADLMALTSESISVNMVNSKVAFAFFAKNKQFAESLKKIYDNIASGEPAVFYDKALLDEDGKPTWNEFTQNVKNTYLVTDMLLDLQKIEDQFNTTIGIPNANTEKKERLITAEVESNSIEVSANASVWLETMCEGVEKAKKLFDLPELSVELAHLNNTASDRKPKKKDAGEGGENIA